MYQEILDELSRPISELQLLDTLIIDANEEYSSVCKIIRDSGHGIGSVYDGDKYCGALLERSLVVCALDRHCAGEMASAFPFQLHHSSTILEALKLAIVKNSYYLPVFDDNNKVDSYLSIRMILNLIMGHFTDYQQKYGTLYRWDAQNEYPFLSKTISLDESRLSVISPEALELPILRVSSNPIMIIDTDSSMEEVLSAMISSSTGIVVLSKFGTLIDGIVTERDYLNKMSSYQIDDLLKHNVHEYMTKSPDYLNPNFRIIYAINNIMTRGYRNVLLVDDDRMPISTISMVDILRFILENLFPTEDL